MCVEILTAGAFIGLGRTSPPSIVGIAMNALRIPASLIASAIGLGLNAVWWIISITATLKGVILSAWYLRFMNDDPEMLSLRAESAAREGTV